MAKEFEELINEMQDRRLTTQAWVTEILRKSILNGYFGEGMPIETTEIANKLGVSRMPVRIALLQLEKEGLVSLEPHKKPMAIKLSPNEVRQIYEIRCELEALAVRQAAQKATVADFEHLDSLLFEMDKTTAINEFVQLNNEFHNHLNQICQNEILQNTINQLRNNVERYIRLYVSDQANIKLANEEHRAIVEALKRKDGQQADVLIRVHLTHTCEKVARLLEESGS